MSKYSQKFKKRWQKLSLSEQLANIGSEVNRVIYWKERKDRKNALAAAKRSLELLDFTIENQRKSHKSGELLRLREVLCDYFYDLSNYTISPKMLKDYFLPFAFLVSK